MVKNEISINNPFASSSAREKSMNKLNFLFIFSGLFVLLRTFFGDPINAINKPKCIMTRFGNVL